MHKSCLGCYYENNSVCYWFSLKGNSTPKKIPEEIINKGWIHVDPTPLTAIIYLTDNEETGGTKLYKVKNKEYFNNDISLEESNHIVKSEEWVRSLFEELLVNTSSIRSAYLWSTGELLGQLRKLEIESKPDHLNGENLGELITLVEDGKISSSAGKEVLSMLIQGDLSPNEYAISNGLIQESNEEEIEGLVSKVLDNNPEIVERIRSGEDKLISYLVGEVMKQSSSSLNPGIVKEIIVNKTIK